jgi:hypothetical protein
MMMVSAAMNNAGSPFSVLSISRMYTSRTFFDAVSRTYSKGESECGRSSAKREGTMSRFVRPI